MAESLDSLTCFMGVLGIVTQTNIITPSQVARTWLIKFDFLSNLFLNGSIFPMFDPIPPTSLERTLASCINKIKQLQRGNYY